VNIIVNGESKSVWGNSAQSNDDPERIASLDYGTVLYLAGYYDPKMILSVTYSTRRKGDEQRAGILSPGKSVRIEDGMIFNVADTSNA